MEEKLERGICVCSGYDPVTMALNPVSANNCECGTNPDAVSDEWVIPAGSKKKTGLKCPVCGHNSLWMRGPIGGEEIAVTTFDSPNTSFKNESFSGQLPTDSGEDAAVQEGARAAGPPENVPGVTHAGVRGGLCLMKTATSYELDKKLIMLKLAMFENEAETGRKFGKMKKQWVEEVINLSELQDMGEKEKKKLATQLLDDFIEFVYSRDNLHRTSDDLRGLLKRIVIVELSRESFLDIEDLPSGFIERFFSPDSPLFDNMKEIIELYHDNSFRNYMRRVVDEAFSADMSGTTSDKNTTQEGDEAPSGSLLSQDDIT